MVQFDYFILFFANLLFPKSIYRQIEPIHGNMVCSFPLNFFVVYIKRISGVFAFPIAHVLKIVSNWIVRYFHNPDIYVPYAGPSLRIWRLGSGNEKRSVIKSKRIFFLKSNVLFIFFKR